MTNQFQGDHYFAFNLVRKLVFPCPDGHFSFFKRRGQVLKQDDESCADWFCVAKQHWSTVTATARSVTLDPWNKLDLPPEVVDLIESSGYRVTAVERDISQRCPEYHYRLIAQLRPAGRKDLAKDIKKLCACYGVDRVSNAISIEVIESRK